MEEDEDDPNLKKTEDDTEAAVFHSSSNSGKSKGGGLKRDDKALLAEMLDQYRALSIKVHESDYLNRFLSRPSIFTAQVLQTMVDSYLNEFVVPESISKHVSLRVKCELAIRRALNLNSDIRLDKLIALENQYTASLHVPIVVDEGNDDASIDGSDSNPSIDNQEASKLLKNLGRYKDTNSLVDALRSALQRKKKRELSQEKKKEQQVLTRLAKQAEAAKRQQIELDQLAERERQLIQQANQKRRRSFRESNNLRPKSGNGIRASPLSAPKYITPPNIRLAPEAKVSQFFSNISKVSISNYYI
jgi:hypothetical protein